MDFDLSTTLSMVALSVLVGLSQAGGIGGGPILSPMMMVLLQLPQRKAIWNTYVMMFGGSIGSFIRMSSERVNVSGSPIIHYKLVLTSLPLLLSGAVVGVAAGKSFPKLMTGAILFVVLSQTISKTLNVYRRVRKLETEQLSGSDLDGDGIELQYIHEEYRDELQVVAYSYNQKERTRPTQVVSREYTFDELYLTSLTTDLIFRNPHLLKLYEEEQCKYPLRIIFQMLIQVGIVVVFTLLKGSPQLPSFASIEYCSLEYHGCNILMLAVAVVSVKYYERMFRREDASKESLGYDFQREGPMQQLIDQTMKMSLVAGMLGGFVGLGGGVILTPLWLDMGIPAPRAAASATMCVTFTSLISMGQIIMLGGYTLPEFVVLFSASSIGSYFVAGFLKFLVIKYKRDSIVIMILIGIVSFALVLMTGKNVADTIKDPAGSLQFNEFC